MSEAGDNVGNRGRSVLGRPRRQRTTRPSVRIVDAVARWIIGVGGIGVVAAFAIIVLFLAWTTVPLFRAPRVEQQLVADLGKLRQGTAMPAPLAMGLDENQRALWILDATGRFDTYRVSGGELVASQVLEAEPITAFAESLGTLALGRGDGRVRVGGIAVRTEYPGVLPDAAEALEPGQTIAYDGRVGELTPGGQLRTVRFEPELGEPLEIGPPDSPVVLVDYLRDDLKEFVIALRADGRLFFSAISSRRNLLTGRLQRSARTVELPRPARAGKPHTLLLGLNGRQAFLLQQDGWAVRYNLDNVDQPVIAEERPLIADPATAALAQARMLLGHTTLIVTDTRGRVSGWFAVRPAHAAASADGLELVEAHRLAPHPAPVTQIAVSARDRQFVTVDSLGGIVLRHMTSGTTQYETAAPGVALVALAPKVDGLALLDAGRQLTLYQIDNPHADGSLAQLFLPLHYEGYPKAAFVYQSSAGTQDAEMKISLVPLIFGTLKATFYAMLFAVPLAILAAMYTSEFMAPGLRAVVKPTVELMASLPSVVLGFIGALVLAPVVERSVIAVLLTMASIPLGLVVLGMIWQLLPPQVTLGIAPWFRFLLMTAVTVAGGVVAVVAAPAVEMVLFRWMGRSPSFTQWLASYPGSSAAPGWVVLLLLPLGLAVNSAFRRYLRPHLAIFARPDRLRLGLAELTRFVALLVGTLLLAWALGTALGLLWDLRGPVVGPYVQRNSLLVGLMMGFAIIPIIYTVSEDALSGVPTTLRSASLGAGATPWQTAVRVVLPVAASGIFSACMIGFGRAAGETMIVLMLSGRTPIIDINIFNGLSALSANIATEMPEAPLGSTHYRILFVSTLVLFALTFIVNTAAELVRARFRRRAYQL